MNKIALNKIAVSDLSVVYNAISLYVEFVNFFTMADPKSIYVNQLSILISFQYRLSGFIQKREAQSKKIKIEIYTALALRDSFHYFLRKENKEEKHFLNCAIITRILMDVQSKLPVTSDQDILKNIA